MKIYIAGIHFLYCNHTTSFDQKIEHIINYTLKEINKNVIDLKLEEGNEEMITLVILAENALTQIPITSEKKKEGLMKLQNALKDYENIILIPGSLTSYKNFSDSSSEDQEKMKRKIIGNYLNNSTKKPYCEDEIFIDHYNRVKTKIANGSIINNNFFQNSTYLLNNSIDCKKIKHNKSLPWYELSSTDNPENYIFYSGSCPTIKKILFSEKIIEIFPIICREHLIAASEEIADNPPILETIVSDTFHVDEEKLYGAINILMDQRSTLSIYVNDQHPKSTFFNGIKAFCYYPIDEEYKKEWDIDESKFNYKMQVKMTTLSKSPALRI